MEAIPRKDMAFPAYLGPKPWLWSTTANIDWNRVVARAVSR
jgi:hypothetical protein